MNGYVLQHVTAVITLIAIASGLSVALMAWLVTRSVSEVPSEDREYKDPPPVGFRMVWQPVQWLSYYIGPLMRQRSHAALLVRLRKAGLDYSLSPAQFTAGRVICAVVAATIFWWLLGRFDPSRRGGNRKRRISTVSTWST